MLIIVAWFKINSPLKFRSKRTLKIQTLKELE